MVNIDVVAGIFNQKVKSIAATCNTVSEALTEVGLFINTPVIAYVNGILRLRKYWDVMLPNNSKVEFVVLPSNESDQLMAGLSNPVIGGAMLLYKAGSAVVDSIPLDKISDNLFGANRPGSDIDYAPSVVEDAKAEPVYSFAGKSNVVGRNNPIETAYGRNRWYPSYVCLPYVEYINNIAYMRVWLSLGHGDFEIENVRIGDSDVNDIPGCFWQYISSNLLYSSRSVPFDDYLADVVIPATDISGTSLQGPDQDDYKEILVESLTDNSDTIDTILVNFAFPSGCYSTDVTGGVYSKTVEVRIAITKESGPNKGQEIVSLHSLTFASKSSQRASIKLDANLGEGRWSVKIARLTPSSNSSTEGSNSQDSLTLESVTGLKASTTTYKTSGIYLLLEASSSLNSDAVSKINVTATRKLPVYNGTSWDFVATRNPVWALVDVLSASYAGYQPDSAIDADYFLSMAAAVSSNFDFIFNQRTTVNDAARAIANSFRGQVFTVGSDYRMTVPTRDDLPVVVFGPDNATDVSWTLYTKRRLDCDCVDVSYVDPITGTEAQVRFTPPGSSGTNPRSLRAQGCTDRTVAWRQGAYSYLTETLGRDTVTFKATEAGLLPAIGELVGLSWPFPSWGVAGAVVSHAAGVLTVTEDLPVPVGQGWLLLQTPEGDAWGPYPCTRTAVRQITVDNPLPSGIDFSGLGKNPVMFTFGESEVISKWFRVTSIDYSGNSARISGTLFDSGVFAYDEMEAPANDQIPVTFPEDEMTGIEVEFYDSSYMRVTWRPVGDTSDYRVRYTWNPVTGSDPTDLLRRFAISNYPSYIQGGGSYNLAKVFNNSALLVRSTGDLYVEVTPVVDGVPDTARSGVWRAQFTSTIGKASVLILGRGGVNAQASLSYAETGDTRSQETQYLDFYSDVPVGFSSTLRLTPKNSLGVVISEYPIIEKTMTSKGQVVISSEELSDYGWYATVGEESVSYILCELVNQDASTISFQVAIELLAWATDYAADSLSVAMAAHGYYDISSLPEYPGRTKISFRPNAFYDFTVRLKQPNKSADTLQKWSLTPVEPATYNKNLVSSNKRLHHYVHGYLSCQTAFPTVTGDGQILCTLVFPSTWADYTEVGGDTPETLIKANGAVVIACYSDEAFPRLERKVALDTSVYENPFLFIEYKADTDEWYLNKNTNFFPTFEPESIIAFTPQEITALNGCYLVLPEWPIPKGHVVGNVSCSRKAMLSGIGPTLSAPIPLGVA